MPCRHRHFSSYSPHLARSPLTARIEWEVHSIARWWSPTRQKPGEHIAGHAEYLLEVRAHADGVGVDPLLATAHAKENHRGME